MSTKIDAVHFLEILDSRGWPTLLCYIMLRNGIHVTASVPSGKSVGKKEAVEVRDKDVYRFQGKGLIQSIKHIGPIIHNALCGKDVEDHKEIDQILIALDGTENKSNLGANFILATSIACVKAAAASKKEPLYRFLLPEGDVKMPKLMANILNGGAHASNKLSCQEYMIVSLNNKSVSGHIQMIAQIFHILIDIVREKGYSVAVGDEGGIAPYINTHQEAIEIILQAIEEAGFCLGRDVGLAFDFAASSYFKDGCYYFDNVLLDKEEYLERIVRDLNTYPIVSIEDPLSEEDYDGWQYLTKITKENIRRKVMIVGDDLFATQKKYLQKGVEEKMGNAVIIKPNQVGTIFETLQTIEYARNNDYTPIISHRSGETEDTFIAEFAAGVQAEYVKFGNIVRGERTAKYNKLMEIEHALS